jgi:hypothetical protein
LFRWESVVKVMSHLKHQTAACSLSPVQQNRAYTAGQLDLGGGGGGEEASPRRLAFALQVATPAFVLIDQVGTSVDGYANDYLAHLRERGR